MDSMRGNGCGKLPAEIIERMPSFLPVNALCRMRLVCKSWREMMTTPRFHDLCDLNGPRNVYLFMWKKNVRGLRGIDKMLCLFDVDTRRWYSIQASKLPRVCARGNVTQLIAVHDGLICELTSLPDIDEGNLALTLSDPVAKTRRICSQPHLYSSDEHVAFLR